MKNIVFLFALVLGLQAYAQRTPKIKGNRNVVEIVEDLPPFNTVELNDDLEIILQKSSGQGYELTADDNLIDVLKFEVEDRTLTISSYYKVTSRKKLEIKVNYVKLNAITANDGDIRMKDVISTDELTVSASGDAKLQLNANASIISIDMQGNSSGDFNLDGDSLNIVLGGKVDTDIFAISKTNTTKMYGNASAKVEGATQTFLVTLLENSDLKGERLEAETVTANLHDSSAGRINASKELELSSSGSSKTYLYGNAKIEILDFSDTTELHKEK